MREAYNRRKPKDSGRGSLVVRIVGHLLLIVVVVTAFLTLVQCSVKSPEAPSWGTQLVIPVINRTYQMEELIEKMDQDDISMDSLGNITFSMSEELDTIRLSGDKFRTDPLGYDFSQQIGNAEIAAPSFDPTTTLFNDISGLPGVLYGDVLPPVGFTVFNSLPEIDNFTTASFSQGTALGIVTNNLGVTLDQIDVRLDDMSGSTALLIANGTITNGLIAGATDTVLLPLAGKTLSNQLQMRVTCHTPGGLVTNPAGLSLTTGLAFANDLMVSSAVAQIPDVDPIYFGQPAGLSLESGESIAAANLSTGNLSLTLTNNGCLGSDITITIPQLQYGGQMFEVDTAIGANSSLELTFDLTDYLMVPQQDSLYVWVSADILSSGQALVSFEASDDFLVAADLTSLTFSSVTGAFASVEAPLEEMHQELELPAGFSDLGLRTAILTIEVDNGVDLPGSLNITLLGNNTRVLNIVGGIAASGLAASARSTITTSDVADFLNPVPEEIDISGSIAFGDGGYEGTIDAADFITARVRIEAPLDLVIDSAVIDDIDIEKEEINQQDIDLITDHVLNAEFNYTITNHLPVGITATLLFSGDSASLYAPDPAQAPFSVLEIQALQIQPAPVSTSSGSGLVSESLVSTGHIALTPADLEILNNETLFIRNLLILTGSDTAGVRLTDNDFITINGYIRIDYQIDDEL
ncbi:MAG: hypothetical protein ABIE70_06435 [bacterium]